MQRTVKPLGELLGDRPLLAPSGAEVPPAALLSPEPFDGAAGEAPAGDGAGRSLPVLIAVFGLARDVETYVPAVMRRLATAGLPVGDVRVLFVPMGETADAVDAATDSGGVWVLPRNDHRAMPLLVGCRFRRAPAVAVLGIHGEIFSTFGGGVDSDANASATSRIVGSGAGGTEAARADPSGWPSPLLCAAVAATAGAATAAILLLRPVAK